MVKLVTILAVVTCLFTLASIGLTAYHSVGHVYQKDKRTGISVRASGSTNTEFCPPAVKVKYETETSLDVTSCPFRPATKGVAFTALCLCQFLLIVVCCKAKSSGSGSGSTVLIFAIIVFPLLLVGGILMIVDMISGKKKIPDNDSYSYQPLEYILDILFVFLGLIMGLIVTYLSYTSKPNSYPTALPSHSQPTQNGNASMSMTKPQWTESEPNSVDYIKPYGNGANISTYQAYQNGNKSYTAQNNSASYLQTNPSNNLPDARSASRATQNYQNQYNQFEQQTTDPNQSYDNAGYGNRRNISYKDNLQARQRQSNNTNYQNAYDNNNGASNGNPGNRGQRPNNRNNQTNNTNANIIYESNANNMRSQGYEGQNQGKTSYERSPDMRYANHGGHRPNKFNSAVNRISAMRGGVNSFENAQNNRPYLNHGGEQSTQGNNNTYETNDGYQGNSVDYQSNLNNYNNGHSRSNNQQYQGENQRNTHISQINGNNIPRISNNNGMSRPTANYGGY